MITDRPSGLPVPAEAASSLRAVLAVIDRGELEADEVQRAYLAGAADALEALAGPPAPGVRTQCCT